MNSGFLYAIGAATTWGLAYVIDQKILINASPPALMFVSSVITALIMLPLLLFHHGDINTLLQSGKNNLFLIVVSTCLAVGANFFILSAIKLLGASSASVIEIIYPFFVVIFSFVILRITPNVYFLFGGLLVFIGSAIIIYFH